MPGLALASTLALSLNATTAQAQYLDQGTLLDQPRELNLPSLMSTGSNAISGEETKAAAQTRTPSFFSCTNAAPG